MMSFALLTMTIGEVYVAFHSLVYYDFSISSRWLLWLELVDALVTC